MPAQRISIKEKGKRERGRERDGEGRGGVRINLFKIHVPETNQIRKHDGRRATYTSFTMNKNAFSRLDLRVHEISRCVELMEDFHIWSFVNRKGRGRENIGGYW
jgi:hypothetical protein